MSCFNPDILSDYETPNRLQDSKKKIRSSLLNKISKNKEQRENRKIIMKETKKKIRLGLVKPQDEEQRTILLKHRIGKGKKNYN